MCYANEYGEFSIRYFVTNYFLKCFKHFNKYSKFHEHFTSLHESVNKFCLDVTVLQQYCDKETAIALYVLNYVN